MKIDYKKCGDYYISNLVISNTKNYELGKYGRMRLNYLKTQRKAKYTILPMEDKLSKHLQEIDKTATNRYNMLIKQLAEQENITEELKAINQLVCFFPQFFQSLFLNYYSPLKLTLSIFLLFFALIIFLYLVMF